MYMWDGAAATPLAAQHVVSGTVVESGDGVPVAGITVTLDGRSPAVTDRSGRFRFERVSAGRHVLAAEGLGYLRAEVVVDVAGETTVRIEVDVEPVALEGVEGRARRITVRGHVVDSATDAFIGDALILAGAAGSVQANPVGRFRLRDIPAGSQVTLRGVAFGYLGTAVTFEAVEDTSVVVRLSPDPFIAARVEEQMDRVDARAEGLRYDPVPSIERDEILREQNRGTFPDLLERKLGRFAAIGCIVIDEGYVTADQMKWRVDALRVSDVHRVEVNEFNANPRAGPILMIRIYTRNFVRRMLSEDVPLVPREQAFRPLMGGDCQ